MAFEGGAGARLSLREAQKANTLSLLLEASAALFIEQGYADTTIDQIARRAGASRATFYLHFDAKWRTAAALAEEQLVPETHAFYRRLDELGRPSHAELHRWIADALDLYERHRDLIIVMQQAMQLEPDMATMNVSVTRTFVDDMPNFRAFWGPDRQAEAHLRIALLIMQFSDFATQWVRGMWSLERGVVVDVLTDLWVAGLGFDSGSAVDGRGKKG